MMIPIEHGRRIARSAIELYRAGGWTGFEEIPQDLIDEAH